ncbi:transposase [Paenibacillus sp. MCAF9]
MHFCTYLHSTIVSRALQSYNDHRRCWIWRRRVSQGYMRYTRDKLCSKEGYSLSVRRMLKPESVFGQIKNNRGFRRFLLRSLPKVSLEFGWLSLAHNLMKQATIDQNRKIAVQE